MTLGTVASSQLAITGLRTKPMDKRLILREDEHHIWVPATQVRGGDNPVGRNTVRHVTERKDSFGQTVKVFNAGHSDVWTCPPNKEVQLYKKLPKKQK